MKTFKQFLAEEDYRGEHRAPLSDDNAPLFDVTTNGVYPDDVYSNKAIRYYGTGNGVMDRKAFDILMTAKGRPSKKIKIYRAVPKGVDQINSGDWVTIVKGYAEGHGQSALRNEFTLLTKTVMAKELHTDGNSWLEWAYVPETKTSKRT